MGESRKRAFHGDPARGCKLDVLHQICEWNRRVQAGENVHVVFRPADAIEVALVVLNDSPNVPEQVLAPIDPQRRLTILG